jgi:hypothetical protein
MKRASLVSLIAIASIGLASQATAIEVFLGTPSKTTVAIGETFTIQYFLNTEGETQITSVFTSVYADPTIFQFVSGASPLNILYNSMTFEALSRVSQPVAVVDPADPAPVGAVHAANFATPTPTGSGVAGTNVVLANLTFMAIGNGVASIEATPVSGDEVTVATASVIGSVTSADSVPITVPEPGAAALSLVAIGTVGLIRRLRSATA